MITYNGSKRTRPYENLQMYASNYLNRIREFESQHKHLSKHIYAKFQELLSDHNSKAISEDDFRKCLRDFQQVALKYNEFALPELHLDQIKKEVEKYFGG